MVYTLDLVVIIVVMYITWFVSVIVIWGFVVWLFMGCLHSGVPCSQLGSLVCCSFRFISLLEWGGFGICLPVDFRLISLGC